MDPKLPKDRITKPTEADRTVRLSRKDLGLEKGEPTQALQMGVPAADATLRLKRDEMSFEEPTRAIERIERPKLLTAMEVIDEATHGETPQVKPSLMMLDAKDIPSWEETLVFPDTHELDELPIAMKATLVMPMMKAPAAPQKTEPMEAMTITPISAEDPSTYLTRHGQSPWPASTEPSESSTVSTQLISGSLLSRAMEATRSNADSALAPVPPDVSALEGNSPLAKSTDIPASPHPLSPLSPVPDRTVDTSIGMAVTSPTLLMPIQPPLDPTVHIERSTPPPTPSLSVQDYSDRQFPVPFPGSKLQTKPIASPVKPVSHARIPMAAQAIPTDSSSKIWIPVAIGILLLITGGIYFAFFRTSLKTNLPIVALPSQTAEPSLPVPAGMKSTLAKAKAGDSKAMHMLGVSFYYGLNVPQNKEEGLRWMRKAAETGNEKAKSDLQQMESGGR